MRKQEMTNKDLKALRKKALLEFWDEHNFSEMVGHLCIVGCGNPEINKLIGIAIDKYDYYYVLMTHEDGIIFDTCVNRCQCIKGKIDEYEYHLARYDQFLDLNPHFLKKGAKTDLKKLKNRCLKEFKTNPEVATAIYTSRKEIETNYIDIKY